MFFIDKYIPKKYDDIFFHQTIYDTLKIMADDDSIPHLLFHGPKGSGKKTMVNIFMHMLFGDSIYNVRKVPYIISGSCNNETVEEFIQSFHHILIKPTGNNHDRYLIHDVIKLYLSKIGYNVIKSRHKFKLIVITNVDIMSESVQFSLRRTIEQYSNQCRFIIISNSISKVVEPLSSRCKCINVRSPDILDIIDYTYYISRHEQIPIYLDQLSYIITEYKGNIKNILWRLEIYKLNNIYITEIENLFDEIKNIFAYININLDFDKYKQEIKILNKENKFLIQSINKYIERVGTELFDSILKSITKYLPEITKNKYYKNPQTFINNMTKSNFKQIQYNNVDKKQKFDMMMFKIKTLYHQILIHIKLLDPIISRDKLILELYLLIKKCDLKYINDIRNIIFNLLITNIDGTEIIKLLLQTIINDERLYPNKKHKLIEVCKDAEYGICKGRREINQFDNLIISIINIITT
jgi:replication factor C subunit 3/5